MADQSQEIPIPESTLGETVSAVAHIDAPESPGSAPSVTPGAEPLGRADDRLVSGRLAGYSMRRAIWVLAWPVLIEMLLAAGVNLVDATMASGISVPAADAVGAGGYILWGAATLAIALGVGATAMVSRAVGRKRLGIANAVVGQSALLGWVGGLIAAAAFFVAAPLLAGVMNLQGESFDLAVNYLRVCALGVPALTFMEGAISSLRGAGDSFRPMLAMIAVNAVNAGTTFLFSGVEWAITSLDHDTGEVHRKVLIANPYGFHMGVSGIALGTTLAWWTGALILTVVLARGKGLHGLRLMRKRMRPHWHTMLRLVRVGMPNFLETFGMWFGNFLTILMVGWMNHPGLLGAHIVAVRIEAFSYLPGFAVSLAVATLVGQYLGAKRPELAERAIFRCTVISAAFMTLMGLVFIIAPGPVVGLFTQQEEHLKLAPGLLVVTGFVQAPFAVAIVLRSALRGAGDTRAAMWITWISTYAIRLPLAWVCCGVDIPLPGWAGGGVIANPSPLGHYGISGLRGFWVGLCAEVVLRGVIFTLVVLRGGWKRVRV